MPDCRQIKILSDPLETRISSQSRSLHLCSSKAEKLSGYEFTDIAQRFLRFEAHFHITVLSGLFERVNN